MRVLSYADALVETTPDSTEAAVPIQTILQAASMGEGRLPKRVVVIGDLVGGKGYTGGREKE